MPLTLEEVSVRRSHARTQGRSARTDSRLLQTSEWEDASGCFQLL